jgi:SAM-dependent methyltransferase
MFLDVGCCVGQVLRKLAVDGVDSTRLYGTDLEPRFVDIGYDLFRDGDKFKGTFVIGDLLKLKQGNQIDGDGDGEEGLDALDGKMTFIHAASFFHLFTWDEQVRAASRLFGFLDPARQDVMIFGRQVGTMLPRDKGKAGSDKVYLHNTDSWQMLWDEVGERTGTKWRATMEPTEKVETGMVESSLRKMSFCVTRA